MLKFSSLLLLSALLSISGCTRILAGASGPEPVGKPSYERSLSQSLQDIEIQNTAEINIYKSDEHFHDSNINIVSFYGTVLITGQVASEELKQKAEVAVHNIADVKQVYNELRVAEPTYYLARANDGLIATRVKSALMFADGVPYSRIKVVIVDATVYVMGKLSHQEADRSVEVIKKVSGVQKIVKILDYIDKESGIKS